jgi:squalene-hopene/tetraprenyl-beta-curcumene cyclase
MSSGELGHRRLRFDLGHDAAPRVSFFSSTPVNPTEPVDSQTLRVHEAVGRTRDYLLSRQHPEGYWVAELEGDTILESEYICLLAFLGREASETARLAANYIAKKQLAGGGWAIYPGGPLEVSASVKAYLALKITGHSPDAEYMVRARDAIRAAGGAEQVNSFTRYYLALLGIISYHQCPAVPPELILLPKWMPFNIYEMSAWSRTIVIPLSLLWAFQPARRLPESMQIGELFLTSPEELPVTMGDAGSVDAMKKKTHVNWRAVFRRVDLAIKLAERWGVKPLRSLAVRRAAAWMQDRFEGSDGLGAIFPPIIWSIIALKCLGHGDDSPDVLRAMHELEKLWIREEDTLRLEPCKSPVWDTAIATIALRDAGVAAEHPAIRGSVDWLLSKETRVRGDWAVREPDVEPSGWYFEFENQFYPDVDDTCMVIMALTRSLPSADTSRWRLDHLFATSPGRKATATSEEFSTLLAARGRSGDAAIAEVESLRPTLAAISRGVRWIFAMQNRDGGWGAFDNNNDREILTRVPFADHNAMIDPSTSDLTSRMLEMFAGLGMKKDHSIAQRGLDFLWREQEPDHCWIGRWGVNYIYGTWQTLVGLAAIGIPHNDPRMRQAASWLKKVQQPCGAWGESPRTYDEPATRGQGQPTASQTAWALMGLIAAGEANSPAVDAGVQYLLDTQRDDGTWDETEFTGTGFPRVFYLKYHYYRIYFPLMALARVVRARAGGVRSS